jgi:hypothetical protein
LQGASPVLRGAERRKALGLPATTGTLAGVGDEEPGFCFDLLKAKRGSQRSAAEAATKQH